MKWFFALNETAPHFGAYADMVKVAVLSARQHTQLEPHLLYDGRPGAFTAWLEQHGVRIVPVRWSLYDEYRRLMITGLDPAFAECVPGFYLRMEIPRLCQEYGWHDKAVLYTDCDILFTGDPESLWPALGTAFFAVAPESDPQRPEDINSGVMLMNPRALGSMDHVFRIFIRENFEDCVRQTDQHAYRTFFRHGWMSLSLLLNWKPYWGANPDARIVHFHGPKPFLREALAMGAGQPIQQELSREAFDHYCRVWDGVLAKA